MSQENQIFIYMYMYTLIKIKKLYVCIYILIFIYIFMHIQGYDSLGEEEIMLEEKAKRTKAAMDILAAKNKAGK